MIDIFEIKWPVKSNINALTTTRVGGASKGLYAGLNLADHVDDNAVLVRQNRAILATGLNLVAEPKWLNQTHSIDIVAVDQLNETINADGGYTLQANCVCAVLTADCLPVFIADKAGLCAGVFHAGWRGLANGILPNAVNAMNQYSDGLLAAIGPAISQASFEVGAEVREAFLRNDPDNTQFFIGSNNYGHFYADLYGLAQRQLLNLGVESVWYDKSVCTFKDSQRFYSYRRDGQTGRMASLIWLSH